MVGILMAVQAAPGSATAGELDVTFGTGGVQTTNFGGTYDWAYGAAVQPDDHILAAGVTNSQGTYDFALARYTPDRALDPTFGDGGTVITDFGDSYDWAYAVALQPDGKIVVGGVSDRGGSKNLALARYLPNGTLDGGFGKGGVVVEERRPLTSDIVHGLAVQPDGRIAVAGVSFEDTVSLDPQGDFILARYTAVGDPDPTFGVGGIVTTDFGDGSYDHAFDVAIQPDARIVVGGYSTSAGGPGSGVLFGADELALARYTPEGLPDITFGRQGEVVVDAGSLDEEIRAISLTRDGHIVAAGFANGERRGDMLLAQFDRTGALDTLFGNEGMTISDFGSHSERLTALAIQPDGWILAAGEIARNPNADFAVVRYSPTGQIDPGFGAAGVASVDFHGRQDQAGGIVLQHSGKPVVIGSSEHDFAVARFNRS